MGGNDDIEEFEDVLVATDKNKIFTIEYIDIDGNVTKRDISHIIFTDEEGFVINAFCHLRKERRTFLDSSMLSIIDKDTGKEIDEDHGLIDVLKTVRRKKIKFKKSEPEPITKSRGKNAGKGLMAGKDTKVNPSGCLIICIVILLALHLAC